MNKSFDVNYNRNYIDDNEEMNSSFQLGIQKESIYQKDIYIYSWGKNKYGELGLGTTLDTCTPSPVTSLKFQTLSSLKSGGRNTIILTKKGDVFFCGSNIFNLLAEKTKYQNYQKYQKFFKKIKFFEENQIKINI